MPIGRIEISCTLARSFAESLYRGKACSRYFAEVRTNDHLFGPVGISGLINYRSEYAPTKYIQMKPKKIVI
jgi:hypothetical protein